MADLQQLDRKIERLSSSVKGDKKLQPILDLANDLRDHLVAGKPASNYSKADAESFLMLNKELRFLSAKPVIFLANSDESCLTEENEYLIQTRMIAQEEGVDLVPLCAYLEQEMLAMETSERVEYLELSGITESGLDQVIRKSFDMLKLISFFTRNQEEVRAWNISQGTLAPQAAGVIHTDFERGFIRAEVIPYETYLHYGNTPQ